MKEQQLPPERLPDPSIEQQFDEVMRRLETLKASDKDFLATVYSEQMEWARDFNELIWTIGAILIPASLAGLALSFSNEKETLVVIALASSGLLWFWLWFAEWHRKLWRRSFTLAGMIEEQLGLRGPSKKRVEVEKHLLVFLTPTDRGFFLRWILVVVGIGAWSVKVAMADGWPPSVWAIGLGLISLLTLFLT